MQAFGEDVDLDIRPGSTADGPSSRRVGGMTVDRMMFLPGSKRDLNLMTERHMRQVSDLPAFQ